MGNQFRSKLIKSLAVITLGLLSGLPVIASAQALEEVLVTATRRGQTDIQVTPISVTALNEEDLDNMLMHDLGDMTAAVPNLVTGNAPAFNSFNPSLRGVGKDGIILYIESPVGVSVDDFVMMSTQTQMLEPFDIETIEVLRGPQGTLFGKNTTAGVINVKTVQPKLNEKTLELKGMYGDFDTKEGKFAANWGTDTFAVRAAGIYQKSDGYYKSGKVSNSFDPIALFTTGAFIPDSYDGTGEDLGGDDVFSGRFKALWQPTENIDATFTYEIIRDEMDSPVVVNESAPGAVFPLIGFPGVVSGDPLDQTATSNRNDFFDLDDGHQVDVDGYYLHINWDIGNYTLHSVTGYREQESRLPSTYMGEERASLFDATRDDDRETFQQEVRIDSNYDGAFNFTVGAFYQHDENNFCVTQILGLIDFFGPAAGNNARLAAAGLPLLATDTFNDNASILCNSQEGEAMAIFGDATFDFTDRLQVGFGVRQSYEKKKWTGRAQTLFQFLDGTAAATEGLFATLDENLDASDFKRFPFGVARNSQSWTDPSFRATAGYEATDNLYAWITVSRSVKSGAYNDQTGTFTTGIPQALTNQQQLAPVDPEFADSLEVGLKMDLFDNRVRVNVVYFDVTYDDAQRQANTTFTLPGGGSFQETRFFNAATLDVVGIEFEGSWVVNENLTISGNWSWQDAEFVEFTADTDFDGISDLDFSGRPVNRSPEWTAYVQAIYEHSLGDFANATHMVSASYVDDSVFTYSDIDPSFDAMSDNRTLINWSTTFTDKSEKYSLRVFGKNLTDERYRTGNLAVATLWTMASYGAPRMFGVELGAKFDF